MFPFISVGHTSAVQSQTSRETPDMMLLLASPARCRVLTLKVSGSLMNWSNRELYQPLTLKTEQKQRGELVSSYLVAAIVLCQIRAEELTVRGSDSSRGSFKPAVSSTAATSLFPERKNSNRLLTLLVQILY